MGWRILVKGAPTDRQGRRIVCMHPKRVITMIKDSINKFNQEDINTVLDVISNNHPDHIFIPTSKNKVRVVNSNNILYAHEPKKGKVFIRTQEEMIEFKNLSFDVLEYLEEINKSFRLLNSGLVVNTHKMVSYNSYFRKVYFENNIEVTVTGAAITNIVSKILGKSKDLAANTKYGEYAF
jgi:hypothetical protein